MRPKSAIRITSHKFRVFSSRLAFHILLHLRQADKNGDGKLSVEEIITIFKVRLRPDISGQRLKHRGENSGLKKHRF